MGAREVSCRRADVEVLVTLADARRCPGTYECRCSDIEVWRYGARYKCGDVEVWMSGGALKV